MSGAVALVGSEDSAIAMADLERELLAATRQTRPRVAVVSLNGLEPGPDPHPTVAERFRLLGAEVEPVHVSDPRSNGTSDHLFEASLQAIGEADLVYLGAGPRRAISRVYASSRLGAAVAAAHARGAIVAGCGASAMLLGCSHPVMRRRLVPMPIRWAAGIGAIPDVVVLPAYDSRPEPLVAALALVAPRRLIVVGIDRDTGLVERDGWIRVYGRGRVTVWRGRHRERFRRGEAFRL